MIISDATSHSIDKQHRDFAKGLLLTSGHINESHFVESILFEPSDSSNLLQLADVLAYAFNRKFNVNDDTFFQVIESMLLKDAAGSYVGRGLKIWPS
jgi:hypothetical protein